MQRVPRDFSKGRRSNFSDLQTTSLTYPPTPFVFILWQHIDFFKNYFPINYFCAGKFFIPPAIQKYPGKPAAKLPRRKLSKSPPQAFRGRLRGLSGLDRGLRGYVGTYAPYNTAPKIPDGGAWSLYIIT